VRAALDTRPARDVRGVGRYTRCLRDALRATAGANELVEASSPRGADVFHSPWIEGALSRSPVPQVVTLHDLVLRKHPRRYLRSGLRYRTHFRAVARAERVIVPTQVVRQEAIELLGLQAERVVVVGEAAAPAFRPRGDEEIAAVRTRFALPEDYFVWVGGLEQEDPRKRVRELAAAAEGIALVLAGPAKQWARELANVTLTGHVTDDELAAILSGARALVFPSDDEGFGLPPVEALACGTPVACSDIPALREVLGERATFVDPGDIGAMLRAAAQARRPAPAPLARTWEDAARETWGVYAGALNSSRAASSPSRTA
jgi:glycosyltransferase involved in cell wall biosynthesis